MVGIASTGFLLVPRLGPQRTALLGGVLAGVFVLLMVVAGAVVSEPLFRLALLLFGYAAGIGLRQPPDTNEGASQGWRRPMPAALPRSPGAACSACLAVCSAGKTPTGPMPACL